VAHSPRETLLEPKSSGTDGSRRPQREVGSSECEVENAPRIGWSLSVSPPIREWNSRGKFTTTSYSLSQPTKAHGSNQLLLLFCKCDALLPAEFHGIQDLLEAGMLADIGQQRIDAQPSGAVVAFAHGTV